MHAQTNQNLVQRLGLGHGAGEAVQDEALLAVGLRQAILDDADDHFIGHQFPGIHEFLGLAAHFGAFFDRGAENVAGGDLRNLEFVNQLLGLGAFASPRAA